MPQKSKKVYIATWMLFVKNFNTLVNKPPTEKNLYKFLEAKLDQGLQRNSLRVCLSHLKLACQELYKVQLDKLPSLNRLINKSIRHEFPDDGMDEVAALPNLTNNETAESSIPSIFDSSTANNSSKSYLVNF